MTNGEMVQTRWRPLALKIERAREARARIGGEITKSAARRHKDRIARTQMVKEKV